MRTIKIHENTAQAALEKSRPDAAGIRRVILDENAITFWGAAGGAPALDGIPLVIAKGLFRLTARPPAFSSGGLLRLVINDRWR